MVVRISFLDKFMAQELPLLLIVDAASSKMV